MSIILEAEKSLERNENMKIIEIPGDLHMPWRLENNKNNMSAMKVSIRVSNDALLSRERLAEFDRRK